MITSISRYYIYAAIASATAVIANCGVFAQETIPAPVNPPSLPPPAPATAANESKPVNFRAPATGLNSGETSVQNPPPVTTTSNLEDLLDRRDMLEGERRVARTRAESARRAVDVQQALGKTEEVERLTAEIRDWDARARNATEQLTQVEEEIARQQQATTEPSLSGGEEVILPGNNLELWVNEDTSFNGRYPVRRGGYIILPQVGRVMVAGKTIPQAESAIRKALQATQIRRATVMLERFEGVSDEPGPMIYLSGEFKSPRPYRIPAGTAPTLVSVILASGGWTDRADLTRVKVMRMAANRSVVEEVNVRKILQGDVNSGGLGSDLTLTEGDVVVIPSGALNLIYVTGQVQKNGSFRIGDGEKLTVYNAILQAGGFKPFARKSRVHVLRAMPDGTKAQLPCNIEDIMKGKRPDIILQANDIVVVPEKWLSW